MSIASRKYPRAAAGMPPQAIPARPLLCRGLTFVQNLSGCLETHVVPNLLKDGGGVAPGGSLYPAPALQRPYLCTEA